jgi:hypothetical protein
LPGRTGASGASTFQRSIKKSSPRIRTRRRVEVHRGWTPEDSGAMASLRIFIPPEAVRLRSSSLRSHAADPATPPDPEGGDSSARFVLRRPGPSFLHPNVSTSSFTLSPMSCILWIGWDGLGTGFD